MDGPPAETSQTLATAGRRGRGAVWKRRIVVTGWVLAFGATLAAGFYLARVAERLGFGAAAAPGGRSVVVAVRDLARLEGAEYHMERVIDLKDKQQRLFGLIEAEDAVLLVAAGSVIAGVDLGQVTGEDVETGGEPGSVTVTLPRSRILTSRLDNERTYVYDRQTDLLADRSEELEARARKHAEETLVRAAVDAGLLDRSDRSVRRTVESLLRSLGFEEVRVELR